MAAWSSGAETVVGDGTGTGVGCAGGAGGGKARFPDECRTHEKGTGGLGRVAAGQLLAGRGESRRERGDEGWTPGWSGGASFVWWRDGGGGLQAGSPAGAMGVERKDFTRARRSWQVR